MIIEIILPSLLYIFSAEKHSRILIEINALSLSPSDIIFPWQFNINRENRNQVYGRFHVSFQAIRFSIDISFAWPFNNYIRNLNRV